MSSDNELVLRNRIKKLELSLGECSVIIVDLDLHLQKFCVAFDVMDK